MDGINRNIVECKDQIFQDISCFSFRINRNIVECKDVKRVVVRHGILVLIETLWNVKECNNFFGFLPGSGINRNIVECKEEDIFVQLIGNLRINRNIVECKGILRHRNML